MKNTRCHYLFIFLMIGILSCSGEKTANFRVANSTGLDRPNATAIIKYDELLDQFGDIPQGKIPVVLNAQGKTLPAQTDDLNNDGKWDDLIFSFTLEANAGKKLKVKLVDTANKPEFTNYTNIRFAALDKPNKEIRRADRLESGKTEITSQIYQMEGPAWENDVVAFRNYLDVRNGFDIFGKTTSDMILDKVGLPGQNYHEMSDWGMDILKVSNSLGSGSPAIKSGDHLIRIGSNGNNTYQYIAEGPVRSILRFHYQIEIPGRNPIELVQDISIRKGEYGYRSKFQFSDFVDEDTLIVGIVNQYNAEPIVLNTSKNQIIASHAKQTVNEEYLGMGLILPSNTFISSGFWDKGHDVISETLYGKLAIPSNGRSSTFFFAGWEKTNPFFAEKQSFVKEIQRYGRLLENPVEIEW